MRAVEATVTSQGQVTIPADVRRHLGLTKGTKVTFVIEGEAVGLTPSPVHRRTGHRAVAPIPGMSTDFDREIEEAMADEADRRLGRASWS